MKIFIAILLIFCFLHETFAQVLPHRRKAFRSVGGTPAFETFDTSGGTGYDQTWTEAGTVNVDQDYTSTVINGTQSLYISLSAQTGGTYTSYTATDTKEARFKFRYSTTTGTSEIAAFRTTGSDRLRVMITGTGQLQVIHGATTSTATVDTMSVNTVYYIWAWYDNATAGDGVGRASFSLTATKPTSGNAFTETTTGTATAQVDRFYFGPPSNNETYTGIYDDLDLADTYSL